MVEERYNKNHHAGGTAAARVRSRLKPSAEPQRGDGDQVTVGNSPNRTITTVHKSGNMRQHGDVRPGEGKVGGR
jgi:hypothetical protein